MITHINKYLPVIISLFLIIFTAYISGCTSAESTTGKLAFAQKDYEKAERELLKGLKIDKNDDEGWYMLGYSQIELGKYKEATKAFQNSLSISNSYADNMVSYWIEKYNAGAKNFLAGIEAEKNKDSINASKNYQSALNYFLASSHIIPDSLKSFKAMGECYLALGDRDKAMNVFEGILSKSKSEEDAIKVAAIIFDAGLGMLGYSNSLDKEIISLYEKLDAATSEEEKEKIKKAISDLEEKSINSFENAAGTFYKVINIKLLPKDNTYYETSAYNYALAKAKIGEKVYSKNPEGKDHHPIFEEALVVLEPLAPSINKEKNIDLKIQAYELLVAVYANLGQNEKAQNSLNIKEELEKERDNSKQ